MYNLSKDAKVVLPQVQDFLRSQFSHILITENVKRWSFAKLYILLETLHFFALRAL
jgi:hypothetical protein